MEIVGLEKDEWAVVLAAMKVSEKNIPHAVPELSEVRQRIEQQLGLGNQLDMLEERG